MSTRFLLLVCMVLTTGGCFKRPGPGPELVDGCYYAEATPILKIEGDEGHVLVDGDVQSFAVERTRSDINSRAIFSPGFELLSGPPIRVQLNPKFPRAYYMMLPGDVPTIIMLADNGGINLKLGPLC